MYSGAIVEGDAGRAGGAGVGEQGSEVVESVGVAVLLMVVVVVVVE